MLRVIEEIGRGVILTLMGVYFMFLRPPKRVHFIKQLAYLGAETVPVVVITSIFSGGVIALQTYSTFHRFNAEFLIGAVVAISMGRELGPVLASLMVVARVGSAMTANIGTMRITEQIDALEVMGINPVSYLISPRIFAGVVGVPMLVLLADISGIFGGWFVAVKLFGVNDYLFWEKMKDLTELYDFIGGLYKALFFGFIISAVSCYFGFYTSGGTEGVGRATTNSVVVSSMLILISDYFLTAIIF
ncbi:MlaE family lipid ABC transporter permease subunit [Hydrogenobacter hydrogenophilus]|uniref:Phospholipid/cholesterol/gamma-HCH transport system permease protein n=1 Tax=Hydrogenobacter hydrogenophilus TaxID=35835 RepID=A0A285NVZ0_9AQUI|nr:MlaE family lipid ABC transporter permease subunit [Hydrogenobacter hydrogenophilus]SNZ12056.1 phospholipid/cholesterol/gamma-HCH transport system permease protein [Hydrogenobacter hydrogenophilus]